MLRREALVQFLYFTMIPGYKNALIFIENKRYNEDRRNKKYKEIECSKQINSYMYESLCLDNKSWTNRKQLVKQPSILHVKVGP